MVEDGGLVDGLNVAGAMPPPFQDKLVSEGCDISAANAASSSVVLCAILNRNSWSSDRPASVVIPLLRDIFGCAQSEYDGFCQTSNVTGQWPALEPRSRRAGGKQTLDECSFAMANPRMGIGRDPTHRIGDARRRAQSIKRCAQRHGARVGIASGRRKRLQPIRGDRLVVGPYRLAKDVWFHVELTRKLVGGWRAEQRRAGSEKVGIWGDAAALARPLPDRFVKNDDGGIGAL